MGLFTFFFSSRRRHTRFDCDWSSDVCSSDLAHRFQRARFLDGRLEPLRIVLKMEGVGGAESCVELVPGAFIDEEIDVLLGGNAAMVPAVGAHVERTDEPVLDVDVPTLVAFLPGVGWNLQLYPFGRAGLTLFFEPGHSRHSGELEGDN